MRRIFIYSLFLALLGLFFSGAFSDFLKAVVKSQLSAFGITTESLELQFPLSLRANKVLLKDNISLSDVTVSPTLLGELKAQGKIFEGVFSGIVSMNSKRFEFSGIQSSLLPKVGQYLTGLIDGSFEEAKSLSIHLTNGSASYEKIIPKIEINSLKIDGDLSQGLFKLKLDSTAGELQGEVRLNGVKLQGLGSGTLTDLGAKDIGPWLALFGGADIKANEEFTISVLGSMTNPMVKVFKK
jgi:hypothetical protein